MSDETVEKSTIREYLLGDLPESEVERIEKWYFAGGQAIDEIWAVFGELAEDRLSGALSEIEAEKFEQRLRFSPALREMFENEKAIRDYAARKAAASSRSLISHDRAGRREWRLSAAFFKSSWVVVAGAVAITSLGILGFLLASRTPESSNPESERQAQTPDQPGSNGVPQPSIDLLRAPRPANAAPEEGKTAMSQPDASKSAPVEARRAATLLLLAGGTRGGEEYPTLEITGQTETVLLELEAPADDCALFSAVLQTESGEEIQRWERLRAQRAYSTLRLARMRVRAGSLKNAAYVARLECSPESNSTSRGEYRFKVVKVEGQ